MNNDLSFWRKLMLDLTSSPKTDADIAYVYRNLVRPEIPASALWDAEKGALERYQITDPRLESLGDIRKKAIRNRGWGLDQNASDMPYRTATGAIMKQLLNPDYLVVPEKSEMKPIF